MNGMLINNNIDLFNSFIVTTYESTIKKGFNQDMDSVTYMYTVHNIHNPPPTSLSIYGIYSYYNTQA